MLAGPLESRLGTTWRFRTVLDLFPISLADIALPRNSQSKLQSILDRVAGPAGYGLRRCLCGEAKLAVLGMIQFDNARDIGLIAKRSADPGAT